MKIPTAFLQILLHNNITSYRCNSTNTHKNQNKYNMYNMNGAMLKADLKYRMWKSWLPQHMVHLWILTDTTSTDSSITFVWCLSFNLHNLVIIREDVDMTNFSRLFECSINKWVISSSFFFFFVCLFVWIFISLVWVTGNEKQTSERMNERTMEWKANDNNVTW